MPDIRRVMRYFRPTLRGTVAVLVGVFVGVGVWLYDAPRPRVVLPAQGFPFASPDGKTVASFLIRGHGELPTKIDLYDIDTGKFTATLSASDGKQKAEFWAPVFSTDGTKVAALSSNDTVHVWDRQTGRELAVYKEAFWKA